MYISCTWHCNSIFMHRFPKSGHGRYNYTTVGRNATTAPFSGRNELLICHRLKVMVSYSAVPLILRIGGTCTPGKKIEGTIYFWGYTCTLEGILVPFHALIWRPTARQLRPYFTTGDHISNTRRQLVSWNTAINIAHCVSGDHRQLSIDTRLTTCQIASLCVKLIKVIHDAVWKYSKGNFLKVSLITLVYFLQKRPRHERVYIWDDMFSNVYMFWQLESVKWRALGQWCALHPFNDPMTHIMRQLTQKSPSEIVSFRKVYSNY